MRRVWLLAGLTALAMSSGATAAHAASTDQLPAGDVTSVSVVPVASRSGAGGGADVVIAVGDGVKVQDFSLASPPRVVIDLTGARVGIPPRLYDKLRRGAVMNLRLAQYRDDVVRVVIDLDAGRKYTVSREQGIIRVSIEGDGGSFAAWHATPELSTVASDGSVGDQTPTRFAATKTRVDASRARPTARASSPPAADEPRITVTYQDADIRDVISAFAVFSGRTIVVGKGVAGTVSAEIRDQPWDVALRAILQSQGLAAREDQDGIIAVDSYENIAAQQATEPLTTQIIPINYARANSLIPTIQGLLSKDCGARPGAANQSANPGSCTTRGSVTADTSTNRLIVTDAPSRLQDIISYIKDLDLRTPQVAIKAKIIFVNRTNIEDLGIAYDFGGNGTQFNRLVQRTDPSTFRPTDGDGDGVPDGVGGGTPYDRNLTNIVVGGNSLAALANANQRVVQPALELVFSAMLGKFSLTAFLDALQEVRLADIQAEPSIVTLDNRKAEILVGEETPIRVIDAGAQQVGGAQGAQQQPRATVTFKETGIILSVTPHITNNRQILMTLHSERSNIQAAASDLGYTFQKQRADNQILVADGETAVVGGLTVTQITQSKTGIPFLVDLPLIGRLFGQTRTQEEKRDLLILVTPHIVDEGERLGPPDPDR